MTLSVYFKPTSSLFKDVQLSCGTKVGWSWGVAGQGSWVTSFLCSFYHIFTPRWHSINAKKKLYLEDVTYLKIETATKLETSVWQLRPIRVAQYSGAMAEAEPTIPNSRPDLELRHRGHWAANHRNQNATRRLLQWLISLARSYPIFLAHVVSEPGRGGSSRDSGLGTDGCLIFPPLSIFLWRVGRRHSGGCSGS